MSGNIQQQDLTIAAGASQLVQIAGNVVDFISSGSAFDVIEVRPDFMQGAAVLKQGQGFDFGAQFNQLMVINKGATALTGVIVISTKGFRNFRISGDVNVIDGSKSRSLAGSAFMAYGGPGPVAAQYGRVQLWNPASNPNRLIVESMTMLANGANQAAGFVMGLPQLATLTVLGMSKKSGGTASAAGIYTDTTAVSVAAGQLMNSLAAVSTTSVTFTPKEPIVIMPGSGITLYSVVLNALLGCTYEWYEEPNT